MNEVNLFFISAGHHYPQEEQRYSGWLRELLKACNGGKQYRKFHRSFTQATKFKTLSVRNIHSHQSKKFYKTISRPWEINNIHCLHILLYWKTF